MDKKNVQFSFSQKSFGKNRFCDHNEKLASHHKKYFYKFVTIKFLYFKKKQFRHFFCSINIEHFRTKKCRKMPKYFFVKIVTLYALREVTIANIC